MCIAMALNTWLLFLVTSVGISLTPGPNGLLALTHGALHGGRKTLFTIAGGLIVSQVLTLFTTPVIYLGFDSLARRVRGWFERHGPQAGTRTDA